MKIFISHSSKDKWAARRIAKDIEELKHEVFLDEKDIISGDSIDDSIRKHLKVSDHLLILLSPASLNSPWVLVELGGAIALEKRIVPILLYVGANEVPQVINLKLARDINDIDKYYTELGGKPTPPKAAANSPESKPSPVQIINAFKVGDSVLIARDFPQTILRREGVNLRWVERMDSYLGKVGLVTFVDSDGDCILDISGKNTIWGPEWLKRVTLVQTDSQEPI